jgi:hypothetical protein
MLDSLAIEYRLNSASAVISRAISRYYTDVKNAIDTIQESTP